METSSLLFSSRETASPGWRTSKKKRLDAAAEASLQPRTACPGTKIAPRRSVCHHHDGAPHGTSRSRMRHCSPTAPQAGAPVNARYFCTSPCGRHGNGHWAQPVCRTKGALGGTAGTALASGAHRMAVAEESPEHIHAFHQGLPRVSLPVTTAGAGRRVMRQGKRGIV